MARKEKFDYKGTPPTDLFIVWENGKWRFYTKQNAATKRFLQMQDAGKPTQLLRYEIQEIVGESNIKRD